MIEYMGWIVAAFFGMINIAYLINKDNRQKGETEIKECVDVLKRTFETAMDATPKIDLDALITQVESLSYLRLVKENNITESINAFATAASDFKSKSIGQEDFIGAYKDAIDVVYNMRISVIKYLMYILKSK